MLENLKWGWGHSSISEVVVLQPWSHLRLLQKSQTPERAPRIPGFPEVEIGSPGLADHPHSQQDLQTQCSLKLWGLLCLSLSLIRASIMNLSAREEIHPRLLDSQHQEKSDSLGSCTLRWGAPCAKGELTSSSCPSFCQLSTDLAWFNFPLVALPLTHWPSVPSPVGFGLYRHFALPPDASS